MSDKFTTDDRALTIQFLGVLHTWLQETRAEKEREIDLLKLQEGIVKIMFARISRPEQFDQEHVKEAAEKVFGGEDWRDLLAQEKVNLAAPEHMEELSVSNVIDFFTRKAKEDKEND